MHAEEPEEGPSHHEYLCVSSEMHIVCTVFVNQHFIKLFTVEVEGVKQEDYNYIPMSMYSNE
jgi:hypothetical protein